MHQRTCSICAERKDPLSLPRPQQGIDLPQARMTSFMVFGGEHSC